jgi:hypothetical protein
MAGAVELQGFKELQSSLKRMALAVPVALSGELVKVAEPVRRAAELKSGEEIRNILSPTAEVDWWRMRTGITTREVYVAPKQRGVRSGPRKRPNLALLLLEKAMKPALAENEGNVLRGVENVLDGLVKRYGF